MTTKLQEANKSIAALEITNSQIIKKIKTGVVPPDCSNAFNYMINNIKENTSDWGKK